MRKLMLTLLFMLLAFGVLNINSVGFNDKEVEDYQWKLTFEDNFDSFDRTKWITFHDNGNRTIWANEELEWYSDDNVKVENGICKLIARREATYGKDIENEKQFEYTSGMICSSKSFLQAYGKWEMRVRFPFTKGCWPAFFLVPIQRPTLPEIDIFEYFGREENKISCSSHWGVNYPNSEKTRKAPFYYLNTKELQGDFSNKWMIWSFECFPDKMIWKLDGNIVYEATDGIPTAPLYIIANVAIKDFIGPIDESRLPYIMEIDYIRAYQMIPK